MLFKSNVHELPINGQLTVPYVRTLVAIRTRYVLSRCVLISGIQKHSKASFVRQNMLNFSINAEKSLSVPMLHDMYTKIVITHKKSKIVAFVCPLFGVCLVVVRISTSSL